MEQTLRPIGVGISTILCLAFLYTATPTIAWGYVGFLLVFMMLSVIAWLVHQATGVGFGVVTAFLIVVAGFSSCEMGRSDTYRDLIGKIEKGSFTQDITPIDQSQIRIVDHDTAQRIGEKELGNNQALGSRAHLGGMTVQNVNGKLWWVAPVLHSGFFAWLNHPEGTPGYIMVSTINPNEYKFIQKLSGKDVKIKYQPNAFFGDDLERHLWLNGYMTKGVADFTFEIDDEGNPYYVVTVYKPKIGFSGYDAVGVAIVDVQTGDIQHYDVASVPAWVDRVQPDDFVKSQLTWWGDYQNGWWNPGKESKLKPVHDMVFVHGTDGHGYWYTTITSTGANDTSISGFVMVDSRTKKASYYAVSGATEQAATDSILGKRMEKKYTASTAILYNIGGRATYVVSLKDAAGIVKEIGMADVENHSIVGVGETIRDALRDYTRAQNSTGNAILVDGKSTTMSITGTISRWGVDVKNGTSYYYFMLSEQDGVEFVGDSNVASSLVTSRIGDKVVVKFNTTSETGTVQISGFDNLSKPLKKGQVQIKIEAADTAVRTATSEKADAKEADAGWSKMSDAEKAEALKKLKK